MLEVTADAGAVTADDERADVDIRGDEPRQPHQTVDLVLGRLGLAQSFLHLRQLLVDVVVPIVIALRFDRLDRWRWWSRFGLLDDFRILFRFVGKFFRRPRRPRVREHGRRENACDDERPHGVGSLVRSAEIG